MECHQAQAQLEFTTLGLSADTNPSRKRGDSNPDMQAAQHHLAECVACQSALESQRRFDSEVARAMSDVSVPPGLNDRLLASVNPLTVTSESAVSPSSQRLRHFRWRWVSVAAIALLLPLLTWGLLAPRLPVLNDASVRQLAELDLNALPVDSHHVDLLPPGWSSLRDVQFGNEARLAPVNGVEIPVLAFLARTDRRAAHVSGFLLRMSAAQWKSQLDATSFSSAMIQYASFGTWVVWRDGDAVYVCVLRGDAHVMERFQNLVAGSRELT